MAQAVLRDGRHLIHARAGRDGLLLYRVPARGGQGVCSAAAARCRQYSVSWSHAPTLSPTRKVSIGDD